MQRLLGFDGERSGDHSDEFVLHSKKPLEIKNIYCYFKSMCMPVGLCTCVEVPQVPTEAGSKSPLELELQVEVVSCPVWMLALDLVLYKGSILSHLSSPLIIFFSVAW